MAYNSTSGYLPTSWQVTYTGEWDVVEKELQDKLSEAAKGKVGC